MTSQVVWFTPRPRSLFFRTEVSSEWTSLTGCWTPTQPSAGKSCVTLPMRPNRRVRFIAEAKWPNVAPQPSVSTPNGLIWYRRGAAGRSFHPSQA